MTDDAMTRLTTYMMLGELMRERLEEAKPRAELHREEGWRLHAPDHPDHGRGLTVAQVYETTEYAQDVLDETRKLCGLLRVRKGNRQAQKLLARLRLELAEARVLKGEREGS